MGSKQAGVKNMEKLIEAMTTYYNGITSYNSDSEYSKFKAHSNNLADKEAAIKLDGNYMFFVARSLTELNNILTGYLTQDIV